jgi:hypothetical protein
MHEAADPLHVLDQDGTIDAELMIERRHGSGVGQGPEDRAADVSGQQLPEREDDHRQQPQGDEREREPAREEAGDARRGAARGAGTERKGGIGHQRSGRKGVDPSSVLAAVRGARAGSITLSTGRDRNTSAKWR